MKRSILPRLGLAIAIALACATATAQEFLPPPELVMRAIEARPEVRAAASEVDAAGAQARAYAVGSHEVELSAIQQRRRVDQPSDTGRYAEWEAQISRRFRLPGKAALDRRIGEAVVDAADMYRDDARHQAARSLLERWMQWLGASATADEAGRQYDSVTRAHRSVKRQVELGEAALKDLELMEVEVAQAEVHRLGATTALDKARRAFEIQFPQLPLPLRPPALPDPVPLEGSDQTWINLIIQRSHEIRGLEALAAAQDATAARARADRIPDPSLGLRVMSDRDGSEQVVGLVLSMPISGRYRRSLMDAGYADAAASHAQAEAMRRQVTQDGELAVHDAAGTLAQWRALKSAYDASAAASQRLNRGWQLGELSLAEWLVAERNHRQIAWAETTARAKAIEAWLRVHVDSHELWAVGH
ncbi:TolC family protein [Lysobacter sp. CW239]|jgi:outer membrane protein TolC|uniref:TolC family protein n=1 Tax=Lysobacteraceae TaxID=32033 RepID=UPI000A035950|nr:MULTISPECIES: TolC family protein [Lysobacter]QOD91312.1 TolC family protein [Lysobacter sp. CW239]